MCKKVLCVLGCFYLFTLGLTCFLISAAVIGENDKRPATDCGTMGYVKDGSVTNPECVNENMVKLSQPVMEEAVWYLSSVATEETIEDPLAEETVKDVAFSNAEIAILERIVEAEAGGEDEDGKLLVANVVLNRVRDEAFPNTVEGVVFQSEGGVTQFSPVANGRYHSVEVSQASKDAVNRALQGEDISEGALYFMARKYASPKGRKWFDEHLTMLFQHGGHEFYK